jgi:hypothetical protein
MSYTPKGVAMTAHSNVEAEKIDRRRVYAQGEKRAVLTVSMPESLIKRLYAVAEPRETSKIVREALEAYLPPEA